MFSFQEHLFVCSQLAALYLKNEVEATLEFLGLAAVSSRLLSRAGILEMRAKHSHFNRYEKVDKRLQI